MNNQAMDEQAQQEWEVQAGYKFYWMYWYHCVLGQQDVVPHISDGKMTYKQASSMYGEYLIGIAEVGSPPAWSNER